jgi:hypothetical protein
MSTEPRASLGRSARRPAAAVGLRPAELPRVLTSANCLEQLAHGLQSISADVQPQFGAL